MTRSAKALRLILKTVYVLLVAAFLIESALPPEVSFNHAVPFANIFTDMALKPDLTAPDGVSVSKSTLTYDKERGVGEVLQLLPEGASTYGEVKSLTPNVIEIERFETETQDVFYLAYAKGAGVGRLSVSGSSGNSTKTRELEVSVLEGELPESSVGTTATVSSSSILSGDVITVTLDGTVSTDTDSTVIWSTTDASVLQITNWAYKSASASFAARGKGTATLRARRLGTRELICEINITVGDKPHLGALEITGKDGSAPCDTLKYDTGRMVGELSSVRVLGCDDAIVTSSDAGVIRIDVTDSGFDAVAVGVGNATVTVSSEKLSQSISIPFSVNGARLDFDLGTLVISKDRIRVGDYFTASLSGTDIPVYLSVNNERLEVFGSADYNQTRLKALLSGSCEIIAYNPSHGVEICRVTVELADGAEGIDFIQIYTAVRKSLGHFAFCLAIGFMLYLAFYEIKRQRLTVLTLSSLVLVSVVSELIQLTVGRKCAALDMLINALGFLTGFAVCLGIRMIFIYRARSKSNK